MRLCLEQAAKIKVNVYVWQDIPVKMEDLATLAKMANGKV
jgi:hypothetical protein